MSCRKIRYITRKEAKHAIKELKLKHAMERGHGAAYRCSECGAWHITSQFPAQSRLYTRVMREESQIKT